MCVQALKRQGPTSHVSSQLRLTYAKENVGVSNISITSRHVTTLKRLDYDTAAPVSQPVPRLRLEAQGKPKDCNVTVSCVVISLADDDKPRYGFKQTPDQNSHTSTCHVKSKGSITSRRFKQDQREPTSVGTGKRIHKHEHEHEQKIEDERIACRGGTVSTLSPWSSIMVTTRILGHPVRPGCAPSDVRHRVPLQLLPKIPRE